MDRLDAATESLKSERIHEITNQQEKKNQFLSSWKHLFLKLKMINQCCIEFFIMSKKAYQAASLSKELAVTHILKPCDKNQQHLVWMMVKWIAVRNLSGLLNALATWMRLQIILTFIFLYFHMLLQCPNAGITCLCGVIYDYNKLCLIIIPQKVSVLMFEIQNQSCFYCLCFSNFRLHQFDRLWHLILFAFYAFISQLRWN